MEDIVTVPHPCFVLTKQLFRFDEQGRQIVGESTFVTTDATDGTTFLLVFSTKNNLNHFVIDSGLIGTVLVLEVDTSQRLNTLVGIVADKLDTPIGLLVDSDLNFQGFPIAPEDVKNPLR